MVGIHRWHVDKTDLSILMFHLCVKSLAYSASFRLISISSLISLVFMETPTPTDPHVSHIIIAVLSLSPTWSFPGKH